MNFSNTKLFFFIGLMAVAAVFTGCVKGDFDEPPINIPTVDFEANTTIAQLKASYTGILDSISDDIIIKGVVVANDESGNLYKQLVIQDETGGIMLLIDKSYLYTEYKLGQRIYVKCKGMYLGDYNKLIQLGYIYNNAIGRLPEVMVEDHIFRDSLPGKVPAPVNIDVANNNSAYINMLVRIENVHFLEVGVPFAPQGASATNRTIADASGNELIVRTSQYANFASMLTPSGYGHLQGILTIYQTTYQLLIRDTADIIGFSGSTPPPPPSGDYVFPDPNFPTISSLEENFDGITNQTDISISGWTNEATKGNRKWQGKIYQTEYYAQATSYNSTDAENVTWIVTPPVIYSNNLILSFKSAMAYYKHDGLSVWILTNYTGNPETATWTQINATLANSSSGDNNWVASGDIPLSNFVPTNYTGNIYIGFRYEGTQTNTTTYRIDEVKINTTGGGGGGGGTVTPVSEIHEMFDNVQNDVNIEIEGWLNLAETGTRFWRGKIFNTEKYAQAISYKTLDNQNICWLITPPVMFEGGKLLNFKSAKAYWVHDGLSVWISTDFNGSNLTTATWTPINATLAGKANADHEWVSSGNISISNYVPQGFTGNFYIAFKYIGDAVNTTTYRIDEVNIEPVK
ncbi:MAG TPA: DUF5689 domain-containing protein [Bacteroidales bacterium]|jgi:hypothetical protein|nr:DUF5689 domain-containing protein [Bacteroidales bacterium]HOR05637.1 DUF5689 domain-containing protein [Bacteroidales bacterium]HOU35376.1 DUF5689 domain-containing protein [Bacteroidales bacterium]HPL34678.1 DUF5689 domain-containing protein [Bacteroidales bacterium]HQI52089.1 DUF5689 domain-containing protein [Bacteroidales bacterium]